MKEENKKEFEIKLVSGNPKVEVIRNQIEPIIEENTQDILFNGEFNDLRKFYKKIYNTLIEKKVIENPFFPIYLVFAPENIEDITINYDDLSAVFNFNIENIKKNVKNIKEKVKKGEYPHILKAINNILNNFNEATTLEYFTNYPKQIILLYVERAKKKKEENKLESKKEELKKQNDKEEKKENVDKEELKEEEKNEENIEGVKEKEDEKEDMKENVEKEENKKENVNKEELNKEEENVEKEDEKK